MSTVLQLDEFESILPKLEFADKPSKFKNQANGERISVHAPGRKPCNVQLATGEADALKAPFGYSEYSSKENPSAPPKYNVSFTFPRESRVFEVFGISFQNALEEQGEKHKADWFNALPPKKRSDPTRELNSVLREPQPDKVTGEIKYHDYQMRVTIDPSRVGVFVMRENGQAVKMTNNPHLAITPMSRCVPIVNISYIWVTAQGWGVSIYLNSILVYPGQTSTATPLSAFKLDMPVTVIEESESNENGNGNAGGAPALNDVKGAANMALDFDAAMDVM